MNFPRISGSLKYKCDPRGHVRYGAEHRHVLRMTAPKWLRKASVVVYLLISPRFKSRPHHVLIFPKQSSDAFSPTASNSSGSSTPTSRASSTAESVRSLPSYYHVILPLSNWTQLYSEHSSELSPRVVRLWQESVEKVSAVGSFVFLFVLFNLTLLPDRA